MLFTEPSGPFRRGNAIFVVFWSICALAVAHLEGGDEGRLRDLDLAELAHPLFAFLLLFEELALAGHVAAIAFGEDVLAQCLDRLAGDDPPADCRLDRD